MSYLDRLRALQNKKGAPPQPTKPTEAPFVGSVGTLPPTFGNTGGGNGPVAAEQEQDRTAGTTEGDSRIEARRSRVLAMLADRQAIRYAVLTDAEADPEAVILALAIRGAMADGSTVTCELRIPRVKYDPFLLQDLIDRHGGTVH